MKIYDIKSRRSGDAIEFYQTAREATRKEREQAADIAAICASSADGNASGDAPQDVIQLLGSVVRAVAVLLPSLVPTTDLGKTSEAIARGQEFYAEVERVLREDLDLDTLYRLEPQTVIHVEDDLHEPVDSNGEAGLYEGDEDNFDLSDVDPEFVSSEDVVS